MKILFWQNVPSIHQAPFMRVLADMCQQQFGTALVIICEEDIPEHRKNMGWEFPDYGAAEVIVQPSQEQRQKLLERNSGADCTHIFSGFDMTPRNNQTLRQALKLSCKTGVYLERPQSFPLLKKIIRQIKYRLYARRYKAIDYMFPVGNMAAEYYAACGFNPDHIFPFAYFVDAQAKAHAPTQANETFKFVYAGRNIPLKRIDLIIRALENLSAQSWTCDFVGLTQDAITQYNIAQNIHSKMTFHGILPNADTKALMAQCDALILPSRYDGWGAVVGEALLAGAKAIVSSEVGAKDLVQGAPSRGAIFKAQSAPDLQDKMLQALNGGPLTLQDRQAIQKWAARAIAPQTGAQYFLECLAHMQDPRSDKPPVPWLSADHELFKRNAA